MADTVVQKQEKSAVGDIEAFSILGILVVALVWPEYLVQTRLPMDLDDSNQEYFRLFSEDYQN